MVGSKINGQTITELTHTLPEPVEEVWVLSDESSFHCLDCLRTNPTQNRALSSPETAPILPIGDLIDEISITIIYGQFRADGVNPRSLVSIQPLSIGFQRIFVSHAVSDEATLLPVLGYLENLYSIEFFICSRIPSQANWYNEIEHHLRASDIVWAFLSSGFSSSTFCAFEIGMSRALKKDIQLFSLDGGLPPAYIQHQQMYSLTRIQSHFPWLSDTEALIQSCTRALNSFLLQSKD